MIETMKQAAPKLRLGDVVYLRVEVIKADQSGADSYPVLVQMPRVMRSEMNRPDQVWLHELAVGQPVHLVTEISGGEVKIKAIAP